MKTPYDPEEIKIAAHGGQPFAVRLKMRNILVKNVENVWRIDEEWWRKQVSRMYFLLEMESGARITVFHNVLDGRWYKQNWAA